MGCLNPGCPNGRPCPDRPIPGCWSQPPLAPIVLAGIVVATWPQGPAPGTRYTIHEVAYAVARAESGRNPSACNWVYPPAGCECSLGLWQVFWGCHPQFPIGDLLDPWFNAGAAREISDDGRWWMPWSQFRNGAYRAYIGEARRAIADFAAAFPPPPPAPPPAIVFRLAGRTCDQWALWAYLQQLIAVGLATLSNLRTLSRDGDVDAFIQRAFGRNGFGTVHAFGIAQACAGGTPPPPVPPPPLPPPLPPSAPDGGALAPIALLVGAGLIVAAFQRR